MADLVIFISEVFTYLYYVFTNKNIILLSWDTDEIKVYPDIIDSGNKNAFNFW